MSEQDSLNKAITRLLKKDFIKWLIVGIAVGLVVGGSIALIMHLHVPEVQQPENEQEESYTQRMATQLQDLVPAYEHVELLGNGTTAIHERLIDAQFNRIYINDTLAWNVSAFVLEEQNGELTGKTVNFVFDSEDVDAVAQGLYDSVAATERVGTYGEPPYDYGELANIYFGIGLFLENKTYISVLVLDDGLVFLCIGTWTSYEQTSFDLLGSAIISPASAFDNLTGVLRDLFAEHLD